MARTTLSAGISSVSSPFWILTPAVVISRARVAVRVLMAARGENAFSDAEIGSFFVSVPGGIVLGIVGLLWCAVAFVEQATEGILITECDGVISYANPAFSEISGFSNEEIVGRSIRSMKCRQHSLSASGSRAA